MAIGAVGSASFFTQPQGAKPAARPQEAEISAVRPVEGFRRPEKEQELAVIRDRIMREVEEEMAEKGKRALTPEEEEELRKAISGEVTRRFRDVLQDEIAARAGGPLVVDVRV